jgi:predicted Zn finger-like uncharacterized protein
MQTTCPECHTTFRVSQDHLGARRGLVRCGTCNAVFNAYDTLLPELESPPDEDGLGNASKGLEKASGSVAEVVAEASAGASADAAYSDFSVVSDPGSDAFLSQQTLADYAIQTTDSVELTSESVETRASAAFTSGNPSPPEAETAALPAVGQSELKTEHNTEPKTEPDILLEPLWKQAEKKPRTWKFWLYFILALLLAGLLGLQVAYFLRAELIAVMPSTRSALEALCRPLNCSVPLPHQLTQSAIAASSLEHDPENKSRVSLTLLLVNRTGYAQAWPQIMLTLSDVRQAPVAKQVFRPQTYLPKEVNVAAGLAADEEREIRLNLDIGNLVASGYKLSLAYR